ncbi:hypothetical protein APX70_01388 [Pseudomonas syringae pv. maculicola]|uniref:Uncharacterized protein n=2 Tax=Pseudomonas syringae group genomosp. 3 TaxID=251701 RepID=A0A3M4AWY1_9PSED|nr:hypothetical protein APX70_01388 [Pseudomonas syringae pv. maculicola]RMP10794.1 hypothetical protein ALQ30_200355 [Pseudomonas syringae pv. persicae]
MFKAVPFAVTRNPAEPFVDLQKHAVLLASNGEPVRRGMKGFGELLLGKLQLLLGLFECGDVTHDHQHCRC